MRSGFLDLHSALAPLDVAAPPRQSRPKRRTSWQPGRDREWTARPGHREWFSDRLFVDLRRERRRRGYAASFCFHVCAGVALLAFLLNHSDPPIVARVGSPKMVPVFVRAPLTLRVDETFSPPKPVRSRPLIAARPQPVSVPLESAAPARLGPETPLDAPSDILPESGDESRVSGIAGGIADGSDRGAVGGLGSMPTSGTHATAGPVRVGSRIKPPRKIKNVLPTYPDSALSARAQGAVLIEAVIGPDGKVQDTRVLHSVLHLDQAALDAVRRWEYEPSFLNGTAVMVIMTVVVNFALQ